MRDERQVRIERVASALHRYLGRELPPSLTLDELDLANPPIQYFEPLNGHDGSEPPDLSREEMQGWQTLGDVQTTCVRKQVRMILANHGMGVTVTPDHITHQTQRLPAHLKLELWGMTLEGRAGIAAELSTGDIDGCGSLCAPIPVAEVTAWQTVADILRSVETHLVWPNHYPT